MHDLTISLPTVDEISTDGYGGLHIGMEYSTVGPLQSHVPRQPELRGARKDPWVREVTGDDLRPAGRSASICVDGCYPLALRPGPEQDCAARSGAYALPLGVSAWSIRTHDEEAGIAETTSTLLRLF